MSEKEYVLEYVNKMKEINESILDYLEDESDGEESFNALVDLFEDQIIRKNKNELKMVLRIVSAIEEHHHRTPSFFDKLFRIIKLFENEIKNYYSNYEIFTIFKKNKRTLLFLFEEKIVIPDKSIYYKFATVSYKNEFYPPYFYPEFKSFYDEKMKEKLISKYPELLECDSDSFQEKRKIGENDKYINKLIQEDSVIEFISYVNRNNYNLSSSIEPSIFETHHRLLNHQTSLIEYSAFFGSIQIFKYLFMNGIELKPRLWWVLIHGKNPDLIHFLEENHVDPRRYENLINESIRCHHIDLMNYFQDNIIENKEVVKNSFYYYKNLKVNCYNFIYLSKIFAEENEFMENVWKENTKERKMFICALCEDDYITMVEFLTKYVVTLNYNVISNQIFLFMKFKLKLFINIILIYKF